MLNFHPGSDFEVELCYWIIGWKEGNNTSIPLYVLCFFTFFFLNLSISVSSVNEKVPIVCYWHHCCLPAQVDWDSVQDTEACLMLLPCFSVSDSWKFTLMPALHLERPDCSYSSLSSFKSASMPSGSDVPIRVAGNLWNHLKALNCLLLNFGYWSNTAAN